MNFFQFCRRDLGANLEKARAARKGAVQKGKRSTGKAGIARQKEGQSPVGAGLLARGIHR